jgi:hypothetical protein
VLVVFLEAVAVVVAEYRHLLRLKPLVQVEQAVQVVL